MTTATVRETGFVLEDGREVVLSRQLCLTSDRDLPPATSWPVTVLGAEYVAPTVDVAPYKNGLILTIDVRGLQEYQELHIAQLILDRSYLVPAEDAHKVELLEVGRP